MDMGWLSTEAQAIHMVFTNLFYSIVLTMILAGVVLSYFKMPMGQMPEFMQLVGRAIIAAFLLAALPEIMNTAADLTDQLSNQIGSLNNFSLVLGRLGEKVGQFTWSWVTVKDSALLLVSYVSFFLLYISVYMANTLFVYSWMLLYIFSPVLIACFVLPSSASATKALFQSLTEVCLWKITWSVIAALLWSFALSNINQPQYGVDFLTAILLNLLLAFSVVVTPMIVRGLFKSGIHSTAAGLGGAILGAAALTPGGITSVAKGRAIRAVSQFKPGGGDDDSGSSETKDDKSVKKEDGRAGLIRSFI
ncbi:MAG: hypothetical protein P4M08_13895 [Oligoflexia bacterium]|nr:hypothetical protein [Oligoflexia bacterium]